MQFSICFVIFVKMILNIFYLILVTILFICIFLKIYIKINCAWCRSNVCLEGKTALVTGGSLGMGYHIVLGLASRGCKVIVADKIINEHIKNAIYKETKSKKILFEYVDLASFESVRELTKRIKLYEKKLDILIHNAGIGKGYVPFSEDNLNVIMQVNYYSAFLMTHLLIDLLKSSLSARLIFASSGASFFNTISLKNNDINFGAIRGLDYHNSKFCMISAADIFAKKLQKYNITSNSYHPWIVKTGIIQQFKRNKTSFIDHFHDYFLNIAAILFGKTPIEGAQTPIHLACANEVEGLTGMFFGETKPRFKPLQAYKQQLCETLWHHSEKIVNLKPEEIL